MKVELDEYGVMHIRSETPIEAYALQKWTESAYVVTNNSKMNAVGHYRGTMLITYAEVRSILFKPGTD